LVRDKITDSLKISAYEENDFQKAVEFYKRTEEEIANQQGAEALLCSVQSLAQLKTAYPNYYLDTQVFLGELDRLLT